MTTQRTRKARLAQFVGSLAVTTLLIATIAETYSISSVWDLLRGTPTTAVLAYLLISLGALGVRALRYGLILEDAVGKRNAPGIGALLTLTAIRNALVDLLPARLGELSFFYVLSRYRIRPATALTTFALTLVLDLVVLAGIVLFALILVSLDVFVFPQAGGTELNGKSALLLGLVGLLALGALLYRLEHLVRFSSWVGEALLRPFSHPWIATARRALSTIAAEFGQIRASRHYWLLVFLTVVLRFAKYGALYLLLLGVVQPLGIGFDQIPFPLAAAAFIAAEASASLPFSGIMGFGAYEGAASLAFLSAGINIPAVPSVILVVHLITQIVGYSIGLLGGAVFTIRELKGNGRKNGDA
ncbi:MAG: flippase-like domain-containing protein [Bdellovibrionales bacterium]|nr:flippase-like domain-containing protein [Bdellovibrionales bacterium]